MIVCKCCLLQLRNKATLGRFVGRVNSVVNEYINNDTNSSCHLLLQQTQYPYVRIFN